MTNSKDVKAFVRSQGDALKKPRVSRRKTVRRRQPCVRKDIQLAHPEFPDDQWSVFDQNRACAEGWAIYEAVRDEETVLEIEKNDVNDPPHEDAPTYGSDVAAVRNVAKKARAGSWRHQRALAIHRKYRARLNSLRHKARVITVPKRKEEKPFSRPRLTQEEHATILAALRYYQERGQGDPNNRSDAIHDIATSGGDITSLDDDGIDDLCELLN